MKASANNKNLKNSIPLLAPDKRNLKVSYKQRLSTLFNHPRFYHYFRLWSLGVIMFSLLVFFAASLNLKTQTDKRQEDNDLLSQANNGLNGQIQSLEASISALLNDDQYLRNERLQVEIKEIEKTYKEAVNTYEELLKLKDSNVKTEKLDKNLATVLTYLSTRNYASASATLTGMNKDIQAEKDKLAAAAAVKIPDNIVSDTKPPASGYRRQRVDLDIGSFMVDIVTADLNSTRVIVDTASDGTCTNDCPVLSLGDYVSRSGAFAGINGSYFCPASYPSCAGKTNSFDTLLMNKNKVYFNSDNNVYSTVPAVIFSGNSARFVGRSLEVGRDTGVDAVIANQPLLVSGGNVVFGGDGDPKKGSRGSRSFVGASGNIVYIGVVHGATVAEVARVLQGMGIKDALNLDSGGSTALWSGRYIAGPGRNIPNAILFVRK